MNPVIMLDEIDKMGRDMRGDPGAALLEVLDPAQNSTFTDHYLGLPFDISKALWIATANDLSLIAQPLQDRMEVIELPGYTVQEKCLIAEKHLIPKQLSDHGLVRCEAGEGVGHRHLSVILMRARPSAARGPACPCCCRDVDVHVQVLLPWVHDNDTLVLHHLLAARPEPQRQVIHGMRG